MKAIGIVFIMGVALIFSYERIKKRQQSLAVIEELYRFIESMRVEIGCYLRPISEIQNTFPSEYLASLGFFKDAASVGILSAYLKLEGKNAFTDEEKKILRHHFSRMGKGYADDEIKLIDTTLASLGEILEKKRAAAPVYKKLVVTLCSAAASALIILFI
ncbi:MAG: hypothetical protein J6Q68_03935 [Clostridia bacterium]|nr:hypothetical protein [Clostridia bacterium]